MILVFCSCVNPILYAFLSDNFRKAFKQRVPRCLTCGPQGLQGVRGGQPGVSAFRVGAAPSLRYELTTMPPAARPKAPANTGSTGGGKSNGTSREEVRNLLTKCVFF